MSTLNGQWLDVFRAGDYGGKGSYPAPLLSEMAASYDPAAHEVPFVKGHPSMDGPALGWTKALRMNGDVLQALPGEMDPAFESEVKAGRFKKRSVAFKQNEDGSLKMPLELRHIGWLGAMPPAIKGLGDARFGGEKFEEIETAEFSQFQEESEMNEEQVKKTVGESMSAWFAETFGGKKHEPGTITQAQVDAAAKQAAEAVRVQFAEELKAERAAREAIAAEFATHRSASGASAATLRAHGFIQGLKDKKRWLPAYDRMGVPAMFAALTSGASIEIAFSDGKVDHKKEPAQLFADILDALGQIVPEGVTFAAGKLEAPAPERKVEGAVVAPGSAAFADAIRARSKERKITFNEAMLELQAEGKSSDTFGGATAGEV